MPSGTVHDGHEIASHWAPQTELLLGPGHNFRGSDAASRGLCGISQKDGFACAFMDGRYRHPSVGHEAGAGNTPLFGKEA